MNPAALKTNIGDLPPGGALIVNSDAFTQQNLNKAAYASNPLTDGSLKPRTPSSRSRSRTLNERALEGLEMTSKQMDLTKNFFALGLMFWLYERSMDPTLALDRQQVRRPGRSSPRRTSGRSRPATPSARRPRSSTPHYRVEPAQLRARARTATSPATRRPRSASWPRPGWPIASCSTAPTRSRPASDILHQLSGYKTFGVKTFQAEDEIAAIGAAIGAVYGGALG